MADTTSVTVDMPDLMRSYFTLTIKTERARRVHVGLWLIRLGAWLSGVNMEIEELPSDE